jgi:hypothetical protein
LFAVVKEMFNGKTVWEGVMHVFDLEGHPKAATRVYGWFSPIEGSVRTAIAAERRERHVP